MSPRINAYSTAVAPDSSWKKYRILDKISAFFLFRSARSKRQQIL
jgi:hypothetical protein